MNRLHSIAAISALGLVTANAHAGLIDLVTNGEFENFSSNSSWKNSGWIKAGTVPGWTSSEGHVELWKQGVMNSPALGSDGLPTGQHAETTGDSQSSVISTQFTIPSNYVEGTQGILSFDMWNRAGSGVAVELLPDMPKPAPGGLVANCEMADSGLKSCGNLVGDISLSAIAPITPFATPFQGQYQDSGAKNSWVRIEQSMDLIAGASYTLNFTGLGGGTSGAHIDQVSFRVQTAEPFSPASASVPTPAPLILLFAGLSGLVIGRGTTARSFRT